MAAWIAETKAEKATYQITARPTGIKRRWMSEAEIKTIVDRLADLVRVLKDADPHDKSEIFRQPGLGLTCQGLVEALGLSLLSEGDSHLTYMTPVTFTAEFTLVSGDAR